MMIRWTSTFLLQPVGGERREARVRVSALSLVLACASADDMSTGGSGDSPREGAQAK